MKPHKPTIVAAAAELFDLVAPVGAGTPDLNNSEHVRQLQRFSTFLKTLHSMWCVEMLTRVTDTLGGDGVTTYLNCDPRYDLEKIEDGFISFIKEMEKHAVESALINRSEEAMRAIRSALYAEVEGGPVPHRCVDAQLVQLCQDIWYHRRRGEFRDQFKERLLQYTEAIKDMLQNGYIPPEPGVRPEEEEAPNSYEE